MDGSLLLFFHSLLRYLLLFAVIGAAVGHLRGYIYKRPIYNMDRTLAILAVVFSHIQLAIGLLLYFLRKHYALDGGSAANRFWKMEHLGTMLVAIALVTIGRVLSKRARDERQKQRYVWLFYFIALALMLWAIPWPFSEIGHGRGWI